MDELTHALSTPLGSIGRTQLQPSEPRNRLSFSTINPKLQIAWDSVSLGAAEKCARYYQYAIVDGWTSKWISLHLRFGLLYHRALEVWDHKKFEGMDAESALQFSLADLKEGATDTLPDGKRVWWDTNEGLSEKKAQANAKTIPNLFRTVIWYTDRFRADTVKTVRLSNGKPAVELSFRYELGYTFKTGEVMLHSGHLDKLGELSGQHWVVDRKTTQSTIDQASSRQYFSQFNPSTQMTGYTYAGRVALAIPVQGVIIDAAQIAKGFSRFERGFSMRTEAQLNEWRLSTLELVSRFERYAEINWWPMNPASCNNFGGCVFREICQKDPAVRETYLKSNFVKRPWDPLETRGDI